MSIVACGGLSSTVTLWRPMGADPVCEIDIPGEQHIPDVKFATSDTLALAAGHTIRVVALGRPNDVMLTLQGHSDNVTKIDVEGSVVYSGSDDGTVRVWDMRMKKGLAMWDNFGADVLCLKLSGSNVYIGDREGFLHAWDMRNNGIMTAEAVTNGDWLTALDVDHRYVVVGTSAGTISVFDPTNPTEPLFESQDAQNNHITACKLRPDMREVALAGSSGCCMLMTILEDQLEPEKELLGHTKYAWDLVYSADGEVLISGSSDGTVVFWGADSGEEFLRYSKPDGAKIYSVALFD